MSEVTDAVQVVMLCGRGAMLVGNISLKMALQIAKLMNTIYLAKWEGSDLNRAKEILAWELTAMVHGDEEANKAQQQARALFGGGAADSGDAPVVEVTAGDLTDGGIALPALLVLAELCKSRSEARTNIQQGGVSIDGQVEKNFGRVVTEEELKQGFLLRRGKKAYKRIVLK